MFGHAPFADRSFAGKEDERVFLSGTARMEVDFNYRIFVSTREFISRIDDSPAHTPFLGRLQNSFRFDRTLVNGDRLGEYVSGHGQIVLSNGDGEYDGLIAFYGLDGRRAVVRIGLGEGRSRAKPYAQFATVFDGTSTGATIKTQSMTVDLRDNWYRLSVPLQENMYGGAGGLDGGADLNGKTKPIAYGYVLNVSPPLVIVNENVYQVNDGAVEAVTAVYDRGVSITFHADYATPELLRSAAIPQGFYGTCCAYGLFRLQSNPTGTVTADVTGDKRGGVVAKSAVAIVRRIARRAGIKDPSEMYLPAFAVALAAQSADIGYWAEAGGSRTAGDAVSQIMASVGGYGGFRRNGKFEVGILTEPDGPPVAEFDETLIRVGSLDRENLPASVHPSPYLVRVGYARNWTKQNDLSGANVTAERRSFVADDLRYVAVENDQVRIDHPFSKEFEPTDSFFRFEADAETEAERLMSLYRRSRSLYSFDAGMSPFVVNLNDIILVTYNRFDLKAGRLMRVVGLSEDTSNNNVRVTGVG